MIPTASRKLTVRKQQKAGQGGSSLRNCHMAWKCFVLAGSMCAVPLCSRYLCNVYLHRRNANISIWVGEEWLCGHWYKEQLQRLPSSSKTISCSHPPPWFWRDPFRMAGMPWVEVIWVEECVHAGVGTILKDTPCYLAGGSSIQPECADRDRKEASGQKQLLEMQWNQSTASLHLGGGWQGSCSGYFFPAFTSIWAESVKPGGSTPEGTCPTYNVKPNKNYHIESKETVLVTILFSPSAEQSPLLDSWAYINIWGSWPLPPSPQMERWER